ncbi:uncharacterized protein ARMOST_22512 [Armillaria ostoyae]|uniref:Uncharacterized protein n=1 Tax=Armillaria ostoyae TaxID=47428 RepID=A0A284RWB6_ARMOS|nr:uncharacterized protein ARMOST_16483 [Armillaria ostoyae]SJL18910.1 uncharacterized protein ARMOST_22512 [Armillaria ostoyae]
MSTGTENTANPLSDLSPEMPAQSTPDTQGSEAPAESLPNFFLTPPWPINIALTREQHERLDSVSEDWERAVISNSALRYLRRFMKRWWEIYGMQGMEGFFEEEQAQMVIYTEKCILIMLTRRLASRWEQRRSDGNEGRLATFLELLDALSMMVLEQYPSDAELGY